MRENGFDLHVPGRKLIEHFRAFPLRTEGKPKDFEVLIWASEINLHIKSTYPIKLESQIESSDEVGCLHCIKALLLKLIWGKKIRSTPFSRSIPIVRLDQADDVDLMDHLNLNGVQPSTSCTSLHWFNGWVEKQPILAMALRLLAMALIPLTVVEFNNRFTPHMCNAFKSSSKTYLLLKPR